MEPLSKTELRKHRILCMHRNIDEVDKTKKVCRRYLKGNIPLEVLKAAVDMASREIKKNEIEYALLGKILGDE